MDKQLQLILEVPDKDFDGIDLLCALKWVRQKRAESLLPPDIDWEDTGRHVEKILSVIAEKYNAAIGEELIK